MFGTNKHTTLLLVIIIIILLFGVGITLYYVLDLDWFKKVPQNNVEQPVIPYTEPEKEQNISLDISKRTYDIKLKTNEFDVVIYKDGTFEITMIENEKYKNIASYKEILNKKIKPSLKNIIKVYEVEVSKDLNPKTFLVFIDNSGNLYKLVDKVLINEGKYAFEKIEGVAKIVDIKQITNNYLTENINGINAIAIDYESNEILITDYLLKD